MYEYPNDLFETLKKRSFWDRLGYCSNICSGDVDVFMTGAEEARPPEMKNGVIEVCCF